MPSSQLTTLSWHVPGTLGADLNIRQKMPYDAQLLHVSAVGSNAYAAGLEIGIGTDADAYMVKKSIGVSNTAVEFDLDDFTTASSKTYPRIDKGSHLCLALDYDYNGGGSSNASANVTITLLLALG